MPTFRRPPPWALASHWKPLALEGLVFWGGPSWHHFMCLTQSLPSSCSSAVSLEIEALPSPCHCLSTQHWASWPQSHTEVAAGSTEKPLCPLFNVRHSYLFSPPDRKESSGVLWGIASLASDLTHYFFSFSVFKKAIPKWAIVSMKQALVSMDLVLTFLFQKQNHLLWIEGLVCQKSVGIRDNAQQVNCEVHSDSHRTRKSVLMLELQKKDLLPAGARTASDGRMSPPSNPTHFC